MRVIFSIFAAVWTFTAAAFWLGPSGGSAVDSAATFLAEHVPGWPNSEEELIGVVGVPAKGEVRMTSIAFAPTADPEMLLAYYMSGGNEGSPMIHIPALGVADSYGATLDLSINCDPLPIANVGLVDRRTNAATMLFEAPVYLEGYAWIGQSEGMQLLLRAVTADTDENGLLDCYDDSEFWISNLATATLSKAEVPPDINYLGGTSPADGLIVIDNDEKYFAIGLDGRPDERWRAETLGKLEKVLLETAADK